MRQNNINVKYSSVLTDNEIFLYAQIVDLFKQEEIDYSTLKSMFESHGIKVEPILCDLSKRMMTVSEAENTKKRIAKKDYYYDEINYFILSSDYFKNVVFCIDYDAIKILADRGIPYYQEVMISILESRIKNSFDTNDELKAKRNMWNRRIKELKIELEKTKH